MSFIACPGVRSHCGLCNLYPSAIEGFYVFTHPSPLPFCFVFLSDFWNTRSLVTIQLTWFIIFVSTAGLEFRYPLQQDGCLEKEERQSLDDSIPIQVLWKFEQISENLNRYFLIKTMLSNIFHLHKHISPKRVLILKIMFSVIPFFKLRIFYLIFFQISNGNEIIQSTNQK